MVVVAGVRRLAGHKQTLALVQQQRRNGGSLTKNKHVEVRPLLRLAPERLTGGMGDTYNVESMDGS